MKISVETSKIITLILDEREAEWLKSFIQNHPDLDNEGESDAAIRFDMFNYLRNALELEIEEEPTK